MKANAPQSFRKSLHKHLFNIYLVDFLSYNRLKINMYIVLMVSIKIYHEILLALGRLEAKQRLPS